jgi:chorismate mutase/prephenate dehydratase
VAGEDQGVSSTGQEPPAGATRLEELRAEIDALDREIQRVITRRGTLALEVARVKREAGAEDDFYRPEREAEILRGVVERNLGPLSDESLVQLFREVISACLALQRPLRVAFLGPTGTFTQAAALKHFGHSIETVPLDTIDAVFREVTSESAHYGVVPVENSTEGVVSHTLDMFMQSTLHICGEIGLPIHHFLLARGTDLASIERVCSHSQSLAQCRKWLDLNLPRPERVFVASNAEAARRALQEPGTAAIAGEVAGRIYGLQVLAANIEDEPENTTRFLVIGRRPVPPTGADKTSVLLSARNVPGSLYHLLEPFARYGINMNRIESRPSRRGKWDYVFFVDVDGHAREPSLASALKEVSERSAMFRVLGSYPRMIL